MSGGGGPALAAAAAAVAASRVKVAIPCPTTSQRALAGTSAGRGEGCSTVSPELAAACAGPATCLGSRLGTFMRPYCERSGRPFSSLAVSVIGATVVGENTDSQPAALADTTRPATTTGTATTPSAQRRRRDDPGVGRARCPAFDPAAARLRSRPRACSTGADALIRVENSRVAYAASAATRSARRRQRSHLARWSRSLFEPANLSSCRRRSAPSLRCRTVNLLSQRRFSAAQHCSHVPLFHAHRGSNLRVAETTVAEDQHRSRAPRQPAECGAQQPAIVGPLDRGGGVERFRAGPGEL